MISTYQRISGVPAQMIGLMSGTSLDGLDIALVEWTGSSLKDFKCTGYHTYRYPVSLKARILQTITGSTEQLCNLNFHLGRAWGKYVSDYLESRHLEPTDVNCIGSHGQTVWHQSGQSTLQVGEPALLSAATGIPVISNFRESDIAAGGTGAPLIPYLDWLLYHKEPGSTIALNIGGISNITCIHHDMTAEEVAGWDTGPGNLVLNTLMELLTDNRRHMDTGGEMASQGTPIPELLERLLQDPFVTAVPPKSTGREYYSRGYIKDHFPVSPNMVPAQQADILATACEWIAASIATNISRFYKPHREIDRIVVSGGGAYNLCLMEKLASHMSNADILTSAEYGVPIDAKEAIGFAVLARAFGLSIPTNLPGVTGASKSVILGKCTP